MPPTQLKRISSSPKVNTLVFMTDNVGLASGTEGECHYAINMFWD